MKDDQQDRAAVAQRIAEEAARLRKLALDDDLGMLAYLLATVISEAETQAEKRHD